MAIEKLSYRRYHIAIYDLLHRPSFMAFPHAADWTKEPPKVSLLDLVHPWSSIIIHDLFIFSHADTDTSDIIRYLIDQYDVIQCFSKSGIPSTMRCLSRKQPYGTLAHPRSSFFFWMFTTIDNGKTTWSYPLQTNMAMENASFSSICSMIFPCTLW